MIPLNEIDEMAAQAGCIDELTGDAIYRFAELVQERTREICIHLIESQDHYIRPIHCDSIFASVATIKSCADAIRGIK